MSNLKVPFWRRKKLIINLVKSFMELEGNIDIKYTMDIMKDHVTFHRVYDIVSGDKLPDIIMTTEQVDLLMECNGIPEIYKCYREMGYFNEQP